jgi:hypothetical protein
MLILQPNVVISGDKYMTAGSEVQLKLHTLTAQAGNGATTKKYLSIIVVIVLLSVDAAEAC